MSSTSDVTTQVTKLLSQAGMRPRGIQSEAISAGLLEGQSIMVCSPTGSGKTLVGEMALLRAVTCDKKGLYLVPLRALAVQVFKTMKDRYEHMGVRIGLSTGDYQGSGEELDEFDIVVTTYERTDSLLRKKTSWLPFIGAVVIDEIQTLSEIGRGARLESLIIRLKKSLSELQIVALSATIGAPDELAEWLGCRLIESYERPIPLVYRIISTSDRNNSIRKLVMTTVQGNGQAIVFHRTRREAEAYAKRLAEDVGRQFTTEEKMKLDQELDSVENYNVTLSSELRAVLRNGIAYHHAGLGYNGRRIVERLFNSGQVRVICATTTLAAGMDLPARTVILSNMKSPSDYKQFLSTNTVHQMLGRAGRPSHDKIGFGVIIAGSTGEADEAKSRYFESSIDEKTNKEQLIPKYERINSTLGQASSLTEQLLVVLDMLDAATIEEIENGILGDSYLIHCAIRDSRAPMRVLQLGDISAITVLERHALPETVQSGRKNLLGRTMIREKNETVLGGIVTSVDGGQYTCRFSARLSTAGLVEGPMCSCGLPITEDGILCHHLITLGMTAASELGTLADYVIPLSLSETSPAGFLIRLGLIEGATDGKIKPTKLGRATNRLYLSIPTVREILALLPMTENSSSLLWLLRHIISIETGTTLDESFDNLLSNIITSDVPIRDLALLFGFSIGDVYGLIDTSRWLLHSISVLAELGSMTKVLELSQGLAVSLERRFTNNVEEED